MMRVVQVLLALVAVLVGVWLFELAGAILTGASPVVSSYGFLLLCAGVIVLGATLYSRKRSTDKRASLLLLASIITTTLSATYPLCVLTLDFARPDLAAIDLIVLGMGLMFLSAALTLRGLRGRGEAAPN